MASSQKKAGNASEIDRLALAFAKEPASKVFIPLAEEYGKAGMWEEAIVVLQDGLKTYPGFITAMVALGRAYEQMNQPVKAMAILEEAIKVSPDNLRAHRTLAKLYAAQGAKDAAIRSCDVILAMNPRDQEALSIRTSFDAVERHGRDQTQEDHHTHVLSHDGDPAHREPTVPGLDGSGLVTDNREASATNSVTNLADGSPPVVTTSPPSLQETKSAVAQLEQWLRSVQTRRRDSKAPISVKP